MRLDIYLAKVLSINRLQVQTIIKNGEITVNHITVTNFKSKIDLSKDKIIYQGELLPQQVYTYIMLNKPKNCLCANHDYNDVTIMDYVDPKYRHLSIVGRLDKDTTGLVVLTDDYYAFKHLTYPCFHHEKEYLVKVRYPLKLEDIISFKNGIIIDQKVKLKSAKLIIVSEHIAKVVISEGKYHQVKKMFLTIHNEVLELSRLRINQLTLDTNLQEGEYKLLDSKEVAKLLENI